MCDSPGLVVGQTHMLYEEVILQELESKGFPRDQAVRYLDANRHNHSTTCYYLILNKRERDGQIEAGRYYSGVNFIEARGGGTNEMDQNSAAQGATDGDSPQDGPQSRQSKSMSNASASLRGAGQRTGNMIRAGVAQERLERQYMSEQQWKERELSKERSRERERIRKENRTQNVPSARRITVNMQRQVSDSYADHAQGLDGTYSEAEPQLAPRRAAMSMDRERQLQQDGSDEVLMATDRVGRHNHILNLTVGPPDPIGPTVGSHRGSVQPTSKNVISGYMNNFTVDSSGK